jgi:branched-chain amino acid transport system substrate-binding protein
MVRLGLLGIAIFTAAALCATIARADILIGVAGPMTGTNAWFGEQMERGAARRWPWPTSTPPAACSASRCS